MYRYTENIGVKILEYGINVYFCKKITVNENRIAKKVEGVLRLCGIC